MLLKLELSIVLLNCSTFLSWLVFQDFSFVLKDLDSLLELGQVLRTVLNQVHVFISCRLHLFIECFEMLQLILSLLLLLCQVSSQQLLHLQLLSRLPHLRHGRWSLTSHRLSDSSQVFHFFLNAGHILLQRIELFLLVVDLFFNLFFVGLAYADFLLDHLDFVGYDEQLIFKLFVSDLLFLLLVVDVLLLFFEFVDHHLVLEDLVFVLLFLDILLLVLLFQFFNVFLFFWYFLDLGF